MSKTLAGCLREFNVEIVGNAENYRRRARQTCAGATLARIFELRGYDHLRYVLMTTFCETAPANKHALLGPVIFAVSDVLRAYPAWFGDAWFQAFDTIDLGEMFLQASANRRIAAPRAFIAAVLFQRMRQHFPDQVRAGARRRRLPVDEPAEMAA